MIPGIRKIIVNRFVDSDLAGKELNVFQPDHRDDTAHEVDMELSAEVDEALMECDIIALRNQLKNISKTTENSSLNEHFADAEAYFGLSEEVFNPVNLNLDNDESQVRNCLQKLHLKNHASASKEIVHDLFSEREETFELDNQFMSQEDELLFEDIKDAMAEKEIIELRANLQSIAQSVSIHERTFEEIEDLVNGDLDEESEAFIRQEAAHNTALAGEIDLHSEINSAIEEFDIMKLRAGLKEMMENEYSHSRTIDEIDDYLNDGLDEHVAALFDEELLENSGLSADLAFHKEVNHAISEVDIMALRSRLKDISLEENSRDSEVLGISSPKRKNLRWYAAASIIILMIAFSSLLNHRTYSNQQLYTSNYKPYTNGANISRSATNSTDDMNSALKEIDEGKYSSALQLLGSASHSKTDGFSINFYSGVAYQGLGEYNNAIKSFNEVVKHGDNLLVEQSEWYIGLCYLRIEEREKAKDQFKSIVSRNGFYREQSSKLLKQLE